MFVMIVDSVVKREESAGNRFICVQTPSLGDGVRGRGQSTHLNIFGEDACPIHEKKIFRRDNRMGRIEKTGVVSEG